MNEIYRGCEYAIRAAGYSFVWTVYRSTGEIYADGSATSRRNAERDALAAIDAFRKSGKAA